MMHSGVQIKLIITSVYFAQRKQEQKLTRYSARLVWRQDQISNVIDRKLKVIEQDISDLSQRGIFPIVGYSYFEYATTLKDSDRFSSLLYAEYALELSNLEMYSPPEENEEIVESNRRSIIIGAVIVVTLFFLVIGFIQGGKNITSSRRKNPSEPDW